jgi:hypothetical protein
MQWRAAKVWRGRSRCSGEVLSRLLLEKASRLHGEVIQEVGRGSGSTGKAGHGGRARAVVASGGACLSRRTPMITGSGGALGAQVNTAEALGVLIGRGETQTRGAG